ncbi:cation transporter, partial [Salmonella enterica subsp. enterica serovar 1,4,[5],12:i:-]|nr:cation transporter [Salmonella sp. L-S2806]MCY6048542.1 cation transporter [Salmonella enterica subsp. enterica serovar 1,4,[5],12:i:-]
LLIAWESFVRLANPVPINFPQAISIAVVGLAVNLLSAWLLRDDHSHHGDHDHHHDHAHAHDNNLQAAYIHVLADALTSVLAIGALVTASLYG